MTVLDYNNCVDQHADGVYRFILKNIRDDELARDIVQEAFARMWEKRDTIDGAKSKSYLFTAAYRIMIDTIRRNKREDSFEAAPYAEPQTDSQYSDLKEVLDEGLKKLPEVQRTVLLLRDYEGYSYQEIGNICNLTEAQVKVYIFRARTNLKNYIGQLESVV